MTWHEDIRKMHEKYGHGEAAARMTPEELEHLYEFRRRFLHEELSELSSPDSPEDVVDALIDLCVVAIGTLDLFGVDVGEAWGRVLEKNMQKESGRNDKRPGIPCLPDLVKPEGWTPPDHSGNIGRLISISVGAKKERRVDA